MNNIAGWNLLALSKISLTFFGPDPTYISTKSEAQALINVISSAFDKHYK